MANQVDKLLAAYKTFQRRINTDIPSRRNQIRSITTRLQKYKPPLPSGR